jgi:hypothetical protein
VSGTERGPDPRAAFLRGTELAIARVTLGLTIYGASGHAWAHGAAAQLFDSFRVRVAPSRLQYFRTSRDRTWRPMGEHTLAEVGAELRTSALTRRLRQFWELEVVDEPFAPNIAFRYRESDEQRCPPHAEVLLPWRTPAEELLSLAIEAGHTLPILAAVGGYTASYSREHTRSAVNEVWRLSKRYLGLDVQSPDLVAPLVQRGLPSVGWLTLIGSSIAPADTIAAAIGQTPSLTVMRLSNATLVQAGHLDLGDSNDMQWPSAMAAATAKLAPWMLDRVPSLDGFGNDDRPDQIEAWRRRLIDPMSWA